MDLAGLHAERSQLGCVEMRLSVVVFEKEKRPVSVTIVVYTQVAMFRSGFTPAALTSSHTISPQAETRGPPS